METTSPFTPEFGATAGTSNISSSGMRDNDSLLRDIIDKYHRSLQVYRGREAQVLIAIYVLVFIFGLAGNVLLIHTICTLRRRRRSGSDGGGDSSPTNTLLLNLAIADLMVIVVCVPEAISSNVYRGWVFGTVLCKFYGFLQSMAVCASILTLSIMAVERLLAIRFLFTYRSLLSRSSVGTWATISLIWGVSAASSSPLLYVRVVEPVEVIPTVPPTLFCYETWPSEAGQESYSLLLLVFMFLLPGLVSVMCYAVISRTLCDPSDLDRLGTRLGTRGTSSQGTRGTSSQGTRGTSSQPGHSEQGERMVGERRRVARLLLALSILFALCWTPYNALTFALELGLLVEGERRRALHLLPFTLLLGHLNSLVNPIWYGVMSAVFRRRIINLVTCRAGCRRDGSPSNHEEHELTSIKKNPKKKLSNGYVSSRTPLQLQGHLEAPQLLPTTPTTEMTTGLTAGFAAEFPPAGPRSGSTSGGKVDEYVMHDAGVEVED